MGNLLNYDNKFFRALGKIMDCILVSALWFIFCIPIFTIGASTAALYYAAHKTLIREKGYIVSTFWEGFKTNFKRSTGIWLIQLVIFIVLSGDCYITRQMIKAGSKMDILFYVFIILMVYAIIWFMYTVCYVARFELQWKYIMKNAAIFAIAHLPWSVIIFILFLAVILMIYLVPPLLFLLPGALFASYSMILEKKVFRKYMSEEDLQRELEDDMYNED